MWLHKENYLRQTKCEFYNKLWCKSTFILEKTKTLAMIRNGNEIKQTSWLGYFLIWQGARKAHSQPTQLTSNAAKSKESGSSVYFILFPFLSTLIHEPRP